MSALSQAHIDGTCGGDAAGCLRCVDIAAMKLTGSDPRLLALEYRRNRATFEPAGFAQDPHVTCPECGRNVPNVAAVRQQTGFVNGVGHVDVGFRCGECGHEWGFERIHKGVTDAR